MTGGEALKGHLDMLVLAAVKKRPLHGYAIIEALKTQTEGTLALAEGTVYPALRRLEDEGYLTSEWEEPSIAQSEPRPPRKYYDLTREGRELLAEAVKRYRLLEQTQPKKERAQKPSRA